MKTITISESEYYQMQATIAELQARLDFLQKPSPDSLLPSIKRGAAKEVITFMADDFSEPLEDYKI